MDLSDPRKIKIADGAHTRAFNKKTREMIRESKKVLFVFFW